MNIIEITNRTPLLIEKLLTIWETSVKATHLFLSDREIEHIKQYVPQALEHIPHLIVIENSEKQPLGFMGIVEHKLEMLFIDNAQRGNGLGKALVNYAIEKYAMNELTVNEQNPSAKGFYERMGFRVYKRSEFDEQGNPYPILFMKR
ncbi:GNAT family N-acetyltransferase [Rodentibacter sp. Ppn85]|uniref:GNAT family N-acetyltransferase n=1 Tax=Rodentibacter sp. Ppn85 TaxID=1908525 RepID=UPI000986FB3D|nr:GNAT family N-acetyltransferase [Rodentibacter sp. Ppn85]OOF65473.1 GNAT family N-acetyltransferase [Rodentibacter sp. Ppn85]